MARKKVAAGAGKAVGGATAFGVAQVLVTPPPDHPFYQLIGFVAAKGARLSFGNFQESKLKLEHA